jgi:hypothetical protein
MQNLSLSVIGVPTLFLQFSSEKGCVGLCEPFLPAWLEVAQLLVVVMWSDPRVLVTPYCMVSKDHFRSGDLRQLAMPPSGTSVGRVVPRISSNPP